MLLKTYANKIRSECTSLLGTKNFSLILGLFVFESGNMSVIAFLTPFLLLMPFLLEQGLTFIYLCCCYWFCWLAEEQIVLQPVANESPLRLENDEVGTIANTL